MKAKIWNGRGWGRASYDRNNAHKKIDTPYATYAEHIYVCAPSVAAACRYYGLAQGTSHLSPTEVREYWSNCWGNPMKEIKPRFGLWATQDHDNNPKRLLGVVELKVDKYLVDQYNEWIDSGEEVEDAGRDEVLDTFTAVFGDDIEADIKVCNGDTGPWIDSVLFDGGCEVEVLEPDASRVEGEYQFRYGECEYLVIIKAKKLKKGQRYIQEKPEVS